MEALRNKQPYHTFLNGSDLTRPFLRDVAGSVGRGTVSGMPTPEFISCGLSCGEERSLCTERCTGRCSKRPSLETKRRECSPRG